MVYNTRSPMNWIQKLQTDGKKIRDTTTALAILSGPTTERSLAIRGSSLV